MVRNEGGGNKMKHLARKHVNGSSQQQNKFLRVSQSKEEIYAYIVRLLGNSMCLVKCLDGYERLCHIRGKFTGRSKRENALSQGTWVLIGLRQWDAEKEFASKVSKTDKKIQKCDLLEIYSASEREKLRVQEKIFQDLITEGNNSDGGGAGGNGSNSDDEFKAKGNIEFKDQKTLEYQEIVAQGGKLSKLAATSSYQDIYSQISDSDDDDSDDDTSAQHQDDKISPEVVVDTITAAATHDHHRRTHQHQQQQQQQLEEVNIDDI
jgi:translation initiation factor IF-1